MIMIHECNNNNNNKEGNLPDWIWTLDIKLARLDSAHPSPNPCLQVLFTLVSWVHHLIQCNHPFLMSMLSLLTLSLTPPQHTSHCLMWICLLKCNMTFDWVESLSCHSFHSFDVMWILKHAHSIIAISLILYWKGKVAWLLRWIGLYAAKLSH